MIADHDLMTKRYTIMDAEVSMHTFLTMIIEESVCFMSCEPFFLGADNSVFPYSNANDMDVTQDLNSFGEIIAHVHCSVGEKNVGCK
jgi:hypothetical protein